MADQETTAILSVHPDVIAIAEMDLNDSGWQRLRQVYPYGCEHREDSPFSLVLWSKQPLRDCRIHMMGRAGTTFPLIEAQIEQKTVFALHPSPPITAAMASFRQNYLTQAANMIVGRANVLVVGDMNSSPFSPVYRQFMNTARVQAKTPYCLPTWLPLGLNIDHVFSHYVV